MLEEKIDNLCNKIDKLVRVLMIPQLEGKNLQERVLFLSDLGYKDQEITEMLGKTYDNIRKAKSMAKKKLKEGK